MRLRGKMASMLFFVSSLMSCAAHDETVATCEHQATCEEGFDVSGCIGAREGNLGEIGGRCGDAGSAAALAVYSCQSTAECADDIAVACADQLAAFENVRADAGAACTDSPGPLPPG